MWYNLCVCVWCRCKEGDIVMFSWHEDHSHYIACLSADAPIHFLHHECLQQLDIPLSHSAYWFLVLVLSLLYCLYCLRCNVSTVLSVLYCLCCTVFTVLSLLYSTVLYCTVYTYCLYCLCCNVSAVLYCLYCTVLSLLYCLCCAVLPLLFCW